jgi:hypothetical protein
VCTRQRDLFGRLFIRKEKKTAMDKIWGLRVVARFLA